MKPIKIDCRPGHRYTPTGFFQIERDGDRIQVRRHNPDGTAASDALTLDFPVSKTALAVEMANLLAGARHA